jgi:hypothetical protein
MGLWLRGSDSSTGCSEENGDGDKMHLAVEYCFSQGNEYVRAYLETVRKRIMLW